MSTLAELSPERLSELHESLQQEYQQVAGNRLHLDLTRGKPASDQLDLSDGLENTINGDYHSADGTDTRNYGGVRGLPEARALGAELLNAPQEAVFAAGNSSLSLMYLTIDVAMNSGLWGDGKRWLDSSSVKLLTPVPGYDRHFALTEGFGIDMINVDMQDDGPDLQQLRTLVAQDPSIKGIWCVPKYANPTGCVYSDEVVDGIAGLANVAAADDFVVLWDNAYAVHDLYTPAPRLASLYEAAQRHDTAQHIVQFASTSKITFAGSGVAFISSGSAVLAELEKRISIMTVGPDKVNQLRHCRFLQGRLQQHMQAHAELLRPKFELVQAVLEQELGPLDIARWTKPVGGYFVSLDVNDGLAKEIVELAKQLGLTMTAAGATFPYGQDPHDRNIRIAPTFATLEELDVAMHTLALCVKLATVKQIVN